MVPPFRKLTVPAAVPELAVTVAVKVTVCPTIAGFDEDVSAVVVVARTVSGSEAVVLGLKLPSPEYAAVMKWIPAGRLVVANVAFPAALNVPVPKVSAPFLNVTVPVGTPPTSERTVAVSVIDWPTLTGFAEVLSNVVVSPRATTTIGLTAVLLAAPGST